AAVAGPPSPVEPACPAPTTVVITVGGADATVIVARPRLFAASRAVTVIKFMPGASGMFTALHWVPAVRVAVPAEPRFVDQVAVVTAWLSMVVPPMVIRPLVSTTVGGT